MKRAPVRSRAKLDYGGVQPEIDTGGADEMLTLLRELGELRRRREAARGGVSLSLPDQEIDIDGDRWSLSFRSMSPVEEWNAQICMLTGMAAADQMIYGRVGLLRTLPPPEPRDVQRLHRTARALGIAWPAEMFYPDFIRSLDPTRPEHAAMVTACARLLRGFGYVGSSEPSRPSRSTPAWPLSTPMCPPLCAGSATARRSRSVLPCAQARTSPVGCSSARAAPGGHAGLRPTGRPVRGGSRGPRGGTVLKDSVGQAFHGVVVAVDDNEPRPRDRVVQQPAVEAPLVGARGVPLGESVTVRLAQADPASRSVRFELA